MEGLSAEAGEQTRVAGMGKTLVKSIICARVACLHIQKCAEEPVQECFSLEGGNYCQKAVC